MQTIKGNPGAPGIAIGTIVLYTKQASEPAEEMTFTAARAACVEQMKQLRQRALEEVGEEQAKIFTAYQMLLEDAYLFQPMERRIAAGEPSEQAIGTECEAVAQRFAGMKQDYLRQRADDIRNVGNLLINRMKGARPGLVLPEGESKVLLAAYELTPADTFLLDKKRLGGLITEQGGATSHTVILAKSMGIPAITGVRQVLSALGQHQSAVMDGQTGELILDPDAQTVQICLQKQDSQRVFREKVDRLGCRQAVTKDGEIIRLCANIGSPRDMDALQNEEYDGIGLFRTEFLYADSAAEPTMAEQEAAYRAVLERADGREVIIRTLDIGGDKEVPYLCLPKEQNPFLGNRGLRLCLERRELFVRQLEAILTASAGKQVKIMFPMVTEISELVEAKRCLGEAERELMEKGQPCCEKVKIGMMVETPAAAVMAESFAACCDFMSIGTNDLTQYVTAADRGNPHVQKLYCPYHPAVIRLIANTAAAGLKTGTEVSVCGELGGNPLFLPLLIGLGIGKLSMAPALLKTARFLICHMTKRDTEQLARQILELEDAAQIEAALQRAYQKLLKNIS